MKYLTFNNTLIITQHDTQIPACDEDIPASLCVSECVYGETTLIKRLTSDLSPTDIKCLELDMNHFEICIKCLCVIIGEISAWAGEAKAGVGAGAEGGGGGGETLSWGGEATVDLEV